MCFNEQILGICRFPFCESSKTRAAVLHNNVAEIPVHGETLIAALIPFVIFPQSDGKNVGLAQ